MAPIPESIPASDLGPGAASVLEGARESNQPLVITQDGKAAAVLLSIAAFERFERERDLLLAFARAEREFANGESFDLDRVLADADALLRGERP